jgi:LacI family transcriptional regulator
VRERAPNPSPGRGVTSHDVARLAGVSQATVSRVLTGNAAVAPERRERVLWALEQTGYRRNALAAAMKTGRTGTIAVVISDIRNPFYPELLATLGVELAAAGHRMILWETGSSGEEHAAAAIREGLVDGLLFTTAMPGSPALQEATTCGLPAVLVNRTIPTAPCDQVSSDNLQAAASAARYLLAAGHDRLALLKGTAGASTSEERTRGFRSVIDPSDARCLELDGDFSHDTARRLALELLRGPQPPTAIFCVNDLSAFGVLDAARACGVAVPRDLWVVGFDDIPMAGWEAFDLTSIRQPIDEMARTAADLLLDRLAGETAPPRHRVLTCDVVVRGSTAHRALDAA